MSISREEVQHIACLARIELTPEDEERYARELAVILDFVEKLREVNTENVPPMTGGAETENVVRADEEVCGDLEGRQVELLEAVPDRKDGWIRVKKVFE